MIFCFVFVFAFVLEFVVRKKKKKNTKQRHSGPVALGDISWLLCELTVARALVCDMASPKH